MTRVVFFIALAFYAGYVYSQGRELAVKPTAGARRWALVIGNDAYNKVPPLRNAVADATSMASAFKEFGYVVTLRLNATQKEMQKAFRQFKLQVNGGDEAVFFFSGHGVQFGAANYLLPVDISSESTDQVRDDAMHLHRVLQDMREQKAKFFLAIIDACRNNPFRGTGRAIGGRGLAPTTAATGQMVIYSAGAGQQALDRLGQMDRESNGLFTRVFLKEMQRPGVPVDRVVRSVREEVVRLAQTVGHEQVPALYDQVVGDFYFHLPSTGPQASPTVLVPSGSVNESTTSTAVDDFKPKPTPSVPVQTSTPWPVTSSSEECAKLLLQLSLGPYNPELVRRKTALNCQ